MTDKKSTNKAAAKRFCLQCDDGTLLAYAVRDVTARSGALSKVVSAVAGWHCPVCADCEFADGQGQRVSQAIAELRMLADKQRAEWRVGSSLQCGMQQQARGLIARSGCQPDIEIRQ